MDVDAIWHFLCDRLTSDARIDSVFDVEVLREDLGVHAV